MCSMQSVPCLSRWCHACRHLHTPQGDLSSRRQAANLVNGEAQLHKLFSERAPRYAERQGGYTRIIRTGAPLYSVVCVFALGCCPAVLLQLGCSKHFWAQCGAACCLMEACPRQRRTTAVAGVRRGWAAWLALYSMLLMKCALLTPASLPAPPSTACRRSAGRCGADGFH